MQTCTSSTDLDMASPDRSGSAGQYLAADGHGGRDQAPPTESPLGGWRGLALHRRELYGAPARAPRGAMGTAG